MVWYGPTTNPSEVSVRLRSLARAFLACSKRSDSEERRELGKASGKTGETGERGRAPNASHAVHSSQTCRAIFHFISQDFIHNELETLARIYIIAV